jgi:photosystem II stability/assembly factor-like uncharacterized protein
MRIFAFLLFCLFPIAYQTDKVVETPSSKPATTSSDQEAQVFFQSADAGKTWQNLSLKLPKNLLISSVFAQDGMVYLGTENGSLYYNSNPELNAWNKEDVDGYFPVELITGINALETRKRITGIFHGRSGPYVCIDRGGFYRKTAGSKRWKPMDNTLEEKTINTVIEIQEGTILVGTQSGIYKTVDDGKTWKHIFAKGWIGSLSSADGFLLGNGPEGLMRSTDGGEHWDCVMADRGGVYNTCIIDDYFAAIRLGGPLPNSENNNPPRSSISKDGGKTWQNLKALMPLPQPISNLVKAGEYLFANNSEGIFRSADGGKTWKLVHQSSENDMPMLLKLGVSGQMVFAVRVIGGC